MLISFYFIDEPINLVEEEQQPNEETENDGIDISDAEREEIAQMNQDYIAEETLLDVAFGICCAPGENQIPLPLLSDPYCKELAYPSIWGGHPRTSADNVKLSFSDHVTSEIRRSDRRAARPDHLLFLHKKC